MRTCIHLYIRTVYLESVGWVDFFCFYIPRFEFLSACKSLNFDDAAGAWLDFDKAGPKDSENSFKGEKRGTFLLYGSLNIYRETSLLKMYMRS